VKCIPLLFPSLLLTAVASAQSGALDQVSPFGSEVPGANSAGYNFDASVLTWQATVVAGIAGDLEGVEFETTGDIGATCDVDIFLGGPWHTGTPAFHGTMTKTTASTEVIFVDMSAAGITLDAGDTYTIQIDCTDGGMGGTGSYESPNNTFFGPDVWLNASVFGPEWRIGFHTWMLAGGALELTVLGNLGSVIDFTVTGATANGLVAYLYAFGTGSHSGVNPITGNTLVTGLSSVNFTLGPVLQANGSGTSLYTTVVPPAAAGLVCVQAVDLTSDGLTNVHSF
jgi:hypothetical protein